MKRKAARGRTKAGTSKDAAAQRRVLFAEAFLANGGNKTQAAVAAGYTPGAASEKAGHRLSNDVRVQLLIRAGQERAAAKARLTTDDVLLSLRRAVLFDPRRLFNDDGSMKAVHELDDDTALALQGVEVDEIFEGVGKARRKVGETKKVKAADRNTAREQAMKHFGLFEADNDQVGKSIARVIQIPAKRPAGHGGG